MTAGAKRVVHVAVEAERRQDQDPRVGLRADDAPGRLDAVQDGHADVHQHDVGSQASGACNCVLAVAGFADDAHLRLALKDLAQADADECLVVGDQHGGHTVGSLARTTKPPPGLRFASKRPP